jgi:hypothetical protein
VVEQVKPAEFRSRRAKRIEHGNDELLSDVLSILDASIDDFKCKRLCVIPPLSTGV